MPEQYSDAPQARTTVVYAVSLDHQLQRWSAEITLTATTAEGATFEGGSTRREFGPFDDSTTVAQWVCQQVHAFTKSQRAELISPPSDPPQGRRLPDSK